MYVLVYLGMILLFSGETFYLWKKHESGSYYVDALLYSLLASMTIQLSDSRFHLTSSSAFKSMQILLVFFIVCYFFFLAISSNALARWWFVLLTGLISSANYIKVAKRASSIIWSDFTSGLVKEVVWDMILKKYSLVLLLVGILLVISTVFFARIPTQKWSWKQRGIIGTLTAGLLFAFFLTPSFFLKDLARVKVVANDTNQNVALNGPGVLFLLSKDTRIMEKPTGYSAKKMQTIVKQLTNEYQQSGNQMTSTEEKPTFIYILSEAFWDPTLLSKTEWKTDPIPTIHRLQKEAGGYMYADIFGGGTVNTEYSVVTNFSHNLVESQAIPYQYLNENEKRVNPTTEVSMFRQLGYQTVAIHPYKKTSYDRNQVFKKMKFDQTYFIERMKKENDYIGYKEGYPDDSTLYQKIENELTENPQFIHGISMQNHFPYDSSKGTVQATENLLANTKEVNGAQQLALYARGVHESDEELQAFLTALKQQKKSIYVVFYGDHLPALDTQTYQNGNITSAKNQQIAKYLTPYFIWNNKGKKITTSKVSNPEFMTISALKNAHVVATPFVQFMSDFNKEVSAFDVRNQHYYQNGHWTSQLSKKARTDLKTYQYLMYDMLEGNRYAKKLFENPGR